MTASIVSGDGRSPVSYTLPSISKDYSIHVTFCSSPDFTIIIPESLEIIEDTGIGEMTVTARDVWIPETDAISVQVSSDNDFNLVHVADRSIRLKYALRISGVSQTLLNHAEIMRVTQDVFLADSDGLVETVLNAKITGTPRYSGSYADSLTFTVSYVET